MKDFTKNLIHFPLTIKGKNAEIQKRHVSLLIGTINKPNFREELDWDDLF